MSVTEFTWNGVKFPAESYDYTIAPRESVSPIGRVEGRVEFKVDMSADFYDDFESWIRSIERSTLATTRGTVLVNGRRGNASNASLFTLARRGRYGGRKGRRASRRIELGEWGATRGVVEPSIFPHLLVRSVP